MISKIVMYATAILFITGSGAELVNSQTTSEGGVESKILVYISHQGEDRIGAQFVAAIKQELSKSNKFEIASSKTAVEKRVRFYIDISTIEAGSSHSEQVSAASAVIEEMGLPNSYPVPFKWYHKIFLLEGRNVKEMSSKFVEDVDAHWCSTATNSVGTCPQELLDPKSPV